ncbi:hypothetical protein B0J12DRAFT_694361 [Macrophomina phaseolina]|uniref:Arrestin-like N-terminal domain-containing protein n=1 Tax=Macrophomina phaseolina TaxID=35725 RepID=A0ABQ8GSZ1_9PEZI|nr:hypothetical protein B0J12DRAFT_694361 [Macrophomina phaseolina]
MGPLWLPPSEIGIDPYGNSPRKGNRGRSNGDRRRANPTIIAASIVLDSDQPSYLSGDDVKGRVRYQCLSTRAIDGIEVRFLGRLKTTIIEKNGITGMHNDRDRVCLFKHRVISGGKSTLDPGIHNWPFSFKFPTTAVPRQVDSWDSKRTAHQFPETTLPPSFHLNARGLITGYSSPIAYFLVAYIDFSDGKDSPATTKVLLNFVPAAGGQTGETEDNAPHEKICNTRRFHPLPDHERPLVKRWSLSKLAKPNLQFRMTLSTPKALTPTEPWRLLFKIDILPPEPKDIHVGKPPQFLLKSINIRMNSNVELRILRSSEHVRIIRDDEKTGVTFHNLGVLQPSEAKEVAMGKMKLLGFSQRYKLLVEALVETVDHAHSFTLKCKEPVVIQPLPLLARDEGEAQAVMRAGAGKAVAADLKTVLGLGTAISEMKS